MCVSTFLGNFVAFFIGYFGAVIAAGLLWGFAAGLYRALARRRP